MAIIIPIKVLPFGVVVCVVVFSGCAIPVVTVVDVVACFVDVVFSVVGDGANTVVSVVDTGVCVSLGTFVGPCDASVVII